MKYVSIDIETTGLNEDTCQILSIGAVIEDTEKQLPFEEIPKFHAVIPHYDIHGEPYALNLNKDLINMITTYHKLNSSINRDKLAVDNNVVFIPEQGIWEAFEQFLKSHGMLEKITVAGKNYLAFDKKFLDRLPGWNNIRWNRRVIDPAVLFVNWQFDKELPDLLTCKSRAGLLGEVTHNALEDAFDVVRVLRTKY